MATGVPALCLLAALLFTSTNADPARGAEPFPVPPIDPRSAQTSSIALRPSLLGGERSRFETTVDPGEAVEDSVDVVNLGTRPIEVRLEAVDAQTAADGAYALAAIGDPPSDAATWVTFDEAAVDALRLAPGEERRVAFALDVPTNATPGDHAGAIVATHVLTEDPAAQITLHQRVALRLIVHVRGVLRAELSPTRLRAEAEGAEPFMREARIVFDVENLGNVALRSAAKVAVIGPFSIPLGVSTTQSDLILPGEKATIETDLRFVAIGPASVVVELRPFADPDAPDPGPITTTRIVASVSVVPWEALAILGFIVAFVGVVVFLRRRARRRFELAVTAAVADHLAEAPPMHH